MSLPLLVHTIFVFMIGCCLGSFLNVCIARWPEDLSVVSPPSRCPKCGSGITWFDNVPVIGWLQLGGKCRSCKEPISPIYPLVELTVGAMVAGIVLWFGPNLAALRVALFATILLGVALTDLKHYLIPDGFTISGLVLAFVGAVAGLWLGDPSPFAGPVDAIFGACVGAGAITIIGWIGEVILKKEAMGFGDATLMAMVGAAVGSARALLTIFVGAAIAAVIFLLVVYPIGMLRARARGQEFEPPLVPFGVFLAPAAFVTLIWGRELIDWYLTRMMG
jgi:leader peptidase (prepilin peptidase)/N-methyltransferase